MIIEGGGALMTKAKRVCHCCGKGGRTIGHKQLGLEPPMKGCRQKGCCQARLGVGARIAGQKRS